MIDIRPLGRFDPKRLHEIGGGYASTARYAVSKVETPERTVISLELTPLAEPYVKDWDEDDMEQQYAAFAAQGHSLGAYDGALLVGMALTELREWNRTLWIWEFHVDPAYRRRGIGTRLMDRLAELAPGLGARILGLETQNTNVPAITFYRAAGFEIDALDLSFYTNHDYPDGEVAIFMKRKLE